MTATASALPEAVDAVTMAADETPRGHAGITAEPLARLLTALSSAYGFRVEMADAVPPPLTSAATATAVVTTVCEMIRAININMFDLTMWFDRPRPRQ